MSMDDRDRAWQLVELFLPFDSTSVAKSIMLQRRGFELTKPYGEALPMALDIGEAAFESEIFKQLRPVEKAIGRLVDRET